jgi:hypothetical protein
VSVSTIARRFGSWSEGVQAAGYSPGHQKLSEEELIDQIDSLADDGVPPSYSEFNDNPKTVAVSTVARRFGSWSAGVKAAGYSPRIEILSEEELLSQIDSLADEDEPPAAQEFEDCSETVSVSTIARRLGSWSEAVQTAGYSPGNQKLSEEELLNQIDSLANGDEPPSHEEFNKCTETVSVTTVARRFGTWSEAVRTAGYSPNLETLSEEELLNQIDSLADGDEPPSHEEFKNNSETASTEQVKNRFGTWNNAVKTAGYERSQLVLTQEQLLANLQRAISAGELNQIRRENVDTGDYPSKQTYENQFGGVTVAAVRGSIDIDTTGRQKAIPLTRGELTDFIDSISKADRCDQAVALMSLLTGCDSTEHKYIWEYGMEDTATDSVIVFPQESKRGNRSVSVGPLYNQFVKMFDPVSSERINHSIDFSTYPPSSSNAIAAIRRISRSVGFDVSRQTISEKSARTGPLVTHRDLRCTHYLFEYCRGASQAMLKRRLALSDNEIEHYHRFLNDPECEDGWSVKIEWRD